MEEVKNGISFKAGDTSDKVLAGDYDVMFVNAEECGRPVLRIILPDAQGNFENCEEEEYDAQWIGVHK